MATIPFKHVEEAEGLTKEVYENIMRTYGVDEPHGIYQLMGHTPEFLAASWPRSRHLYGNDSNFSLRDKHLLTLGISATNNCEYCVRIHTERLVQLGVTPQELVELMMVVDVVNGFSQFAEGTRSGDTPVIAPLDEDEADAAAEEVYREIKSAYGNREPDEIYRIMGHDPAYLQASWARAKLCFEVEGRLGLRLKHMIALSVAATCGNDHLIAAHRTRLEDLGLSDAEVVELLLVIDLTCGYNRYVQGLQANMESRPFGADAEANQADSVRNAGG